MRPVKRSLVLVLLAAFILLNAPQASAQGLAGIELENVVAFITFGEQINFVATVKASVPIQEAAIVILDEAQGVTHIEPLSLQDGGLTEFRYDARRYALRPFSKLNWNYRFTLPDGSIMHSEVFTTHYEDNRFQWQSLESGNLRVHWYGGDAGFGQAALDTVQAGLDSVSRLIPVDLNQPVEFYIYANVDDMRGTLVPGSQEWIAGHADPSLGVVMVAVEPSPMQDITMQQRIPHELMHVMYYRVAGQGYQNIPAWLSEGIAALAETVPNLEYERVLADALARNDWIPIRHLCGPFPAEADRAYLAYAESRSFTGYLFETYGSPGLLQLTRAYAGGAECEEGPEQAFGIPLTSLERDWHAATTGQKPIPGMQNITPYLVLFCLILVVPMIGILSSLRKKGNRNEPEIFIRK